ncbi:hypothetical protein ABZ471_37000 [Streptomyces sp. NPDC005728]|uniref:hypothetical protein n=1 Tax=Streptomyces sp. NPDC005728 TaxID=3157054 RepID=UPI0033C632AF
MDATRQCRSSSAWNSAAGPGDRQQKRHIADIFKAEIPGFSKWKLAKAFLQWLTDHGWSDLTADEQTAWQMFAAVNRGLA